MIIKENILKDFIISAHPEWLVCDVYHTHEYDKAIQVDVKYYENKVLQGKRITFSKKAYVDFIIKSRNKKIKKIIDK